MEVVVGMAMRSPAAAAAAAAPYPGIPGGGGGGRGFGSLKVAARRRRVAVVEAKGRGRWAQRQVQRPPQPELPKIEDDDPRFVIFVRSAEVYFWYPVCLITGGTTAKILVAAKDTFVGKYIYKDTLNKTLAAGLYKDEKEVQKAALKQYRVLQSAKAFRYGYKLVENRDVRTALATSNVIELPKKEELKTVADKLKDFLGEATSGVKESFGKLTSLGSISKEEAEAD